MDKTNISITNVMVFRSDHESKDGTWYSYAMQYSSKQADGTYKKKSRELRFKKGEVVSNRTIIDIDEGLLTFRSYIAKGGESVDVDYIQIMDYKVVKTADEMPGFTAIKDEDIPF